MLGTRLASSPSEIRQGWIGDELPATTITEAWVGAGEVFWELLVQDTVMEEVDTDTEDSKELTPSMSTLGVRNDHKTVIWHTKLVIWSL